METIEQAQNRLENLSMDGKNGFFRGVLWANHWFDFEEVKPTEQGHYLVKCKTSYPKNCDVVVAEFYEDNKTFYSESSDCPLHDVTHWRPIERS